MYSRPDLFAVVRRLADELHAFVGIERRHTLLGEVEVIGSIVEALFGLRIGSHDASLLARRVARVVVELDAPKPMSVRSLVRPWTFSPSMLMLATVFASG